MRGLQQALGWSDNMQSSPTLSDLHPSFANLDHVHRLINKLRSKRYPNGTGFKGNIYSVRVSFIDYNYYKVFVTLCEMK